MLNSFLNMKNLRFFVLVKLKKLKIRYLFDDLFCHLIEKFIDDNSKKNLVNLTLILLE